MRKSLLGVTLAFFVMYPGSGIAASKSSEVNSMALSKEINRIAAMMMMIGMNRVVENMDPSPTVGQQRFYCLPPKLANNPELLINRVSKKLKGSHNLHEVADALFTESRMKYPCKPPPIRTKPHPVMGTKLAIDGTDPNDPAAGYNMIVSTFIGMDVLNHFIEKSGQRPFYCLPRNKRHPGFMIEVVSKKMKGTHGIDKVIQTFITEARKKYPCK